MRRIGTHVGNQTGLPSRAFQIDAFVQLLRGAHGTLQLETQSVGSGLLHRGRNERRRRAAGRSFGFD